jgi:hypothetical protein
LIVGGQCLDRATSQNQIVYHLSTWHYVTPRINNNKYQGEGKERGRKGIGRRRKGGQRRRGEEEGQ